MIIWITCVTIPKMFLDIESLIVSIDEKVLHIHQKLEIQESYIEKF